MRALAEYDGAGYLGFQVQRDAPTVQGVLEQALQRLTGQATRIRYAGRTDAGVPRQRAGDRSAGALATQS